MNYEEMWNTLKDRLEQASQRKHSELQYRMMMYSGYNAANDVFLLMGKMERGEEIPPLFKGVKTDD